MNELPSYKPSAYYFRRAIRGARDLNTVKQISLHLVRELEEHKQFIRDLGMIPPRRFVLTAEAEAKKCPQEQPESTSSFSL